jgi:hypothetical protein
VIRSKLDYGAPILTTIPKTKLKKLKTNHNQILRDILGCFKSTPIPLIQIETGISHIKDRWDMLATRYLTNLSTKTSAIQAISNFKWKSSNYIPEINKQINNLRSAGAKINLFGIPSHAGIRGKEIALRPTTEEQQTTAKRCVTHPTWPSN